MAEGQTNRNEQTSKRGDRFQISVEPVIWAGADEARGDLNESLSLARERGARILFAIARDPQTIFASWIIDWASVFKNVPPVDRQVHLRLHGSDGLQEKSVAVEPMAMMHCLTASGLHTSCHVEIGYYQPPEVWHLVAKSQEIVMPPDASDETADVDLATIPFHLGFEQLLTLFRSDSKTHLAVAISQFEKHVLSSEQAERLNGADKELLGELGLSLPQMVMAWRQFAETDAQKLMKLTAERLGLHATSSSREFCESSWS
jgi:hypothetical protein